VRPLPWSRSIAEEVVWRQNRGWGGRNGLGHSAPCCRVKHRAPSGNVPDIRSTAPRAELLAKWSLFVSAITSLEPG